MDYIEANIRQTMTETGRHTQYYMALNANTYFYCLRHRQTTQTFMLFPLLPGLLMARLPFSLLWEQVSRMPSPRGSQQYCSRLLFLQ